MTLDDSLLLNLPHGSQLQHIVFTAEDADERNVLLNFPSPIKHRAVLAAGRAQAAAPGEELFLLSIAAADQEDLDLLAKVQTWAEGSDARGNPKCQTITLQGVQIIWGQNRAAVIAHADRLDSVRKAVIEVAFYDAELHGVELGLGKCWPHLEADAPLAFEFEERSVRKRHQLAERFQEIIGVRVRLARITPHILFPHVHPPTLASQVGERLRERNRMAHRVEYLEGQLEVFERVYDACGQRTSEFMLFRRSNMLEWMIILLLLTQILLSGFDHLSALAK